MCLAIPGRILSISDEGLATRRGRVSFGGIVNLRTESMTAEGIPTIPPNAIEPFLSQPVLIEPGGLDLAPRIVAFDSRRVIVGDGGKAFVRGMGDSKEGSWLLYRQGNALIDPDTNTTLGYEAIYLGTAKLVQPGDPATIEVATVAQGLMSIAILALTVVLIPAAWSFRKSYKKVNDLIDRESGQHLSNIRNTKFAADSSLLKRENVHFVDGPSQHTLMTHRFTKPLQLAFIDGPHGPMSDHGHVEHGMEVLTKPFAIEDLASRVDRMLREEPAARPQ